MKVGIDYIGITVAFYCNDGKGNFVMHQRGKKARDERGTWDFGGGQLEFGETLEKAVLREVKEEYGVTGTIQEQVPTHSVFRTIDGVKTHWLAIPFFVKVDIKKAKIMEPSKFSAIKTVRLDNLPTPIHSGLLQALTTYKPYFDRYRSSVKV